MTEPRFTLKMILVGDPGVGKTALISRYVHGKFSKDYAMTVGFNITIKELEIEKSGIMHSVSLSINDIGGQERFEGVRHMFYPGTHVALLVYDVTRPDSLDNLVSIWIKEIHEFNPPREDEPPLQMTIVGNKCDLEETRMIETSEGEEVAKKLGAIKHIETSAKDNKNVDTAFHELTEIFLQKAEGVKFLIQTSSGQT